MYDAEVLNRILQSVMSAKSLQEYYHVEDYPTERLPIRVSFAQEQLLELAVEIKLELYGQPVEFGDRDELNKKGLPHVEFLRIAILDDHAYVALRYAVEGIIGHGLFIPGRKSWHLAALGITEM